jgi:ribonuclease J
MQITIHRGSHEVGGNCIEVQAGATRLILDVGMPLFGPDREPYDDWGLDKKSKEELATLGILPKVSGLFSEGDQPDAILLSHAHQDHTGLLRHSDAGIPVFASRGTSKMMDAGFRFAGQPYLPRARFNEIPPGKPIQIGEATVTGYSVDHSIYGAMAFLIEAENKRILYSGDLRLHGRKPGMIKTLLAAVQDKPIDVLLMEGTHIAHVDYRGPSEHELEKTITEQIESAPGIVLASFSPQHLDRLVVFLRATRESGRTFIADAYTGYILHLLRNEVAIPPPESTEWIKIFFPKFFRESFRRKGLENVFSLLSSGNIEMDAIRANPSHYVMIFRPSMLESDFGGILPSQARCIFSRWHGYLNQKDWQPVKSALDTIGGDLIESHTSGHIYEQDIIGLISRIKAELVIPIHSFEPHRFSDNIINSHVLADGEPYILT